MYSFSDPKCRCWEPEVLEKMSSHYKTKQPLSPALIEKIIKRSTSICYGCNLLNRVHSRYVNVGLFYLRQVFFAKFDIKVHTDQGTSDPRLLLSALNVGQRAKTTHCCGIAFAKRYLL
jgi:metallopeptidase MepB